MKITKLYNILYEQEEQPENVMVVTDDDLVTVDDTEASEAIDDDADLIVATLEGTEEREEGVDAPETEESQQAEKTTSTANDSSGAEELEKALAVEPPDVFSGAVLEEAVGDKSFVERMVSKSGGLLRYGGPKDGAYRLRLRDSKADLAKAIKSALRGFKMKIIKPGAKTGKLVAKSSKFNTYYVKTPAGNFVAVVFSAGANEGQKFEKTIKNSIASRKGKAYEALLDALQRFYGIDSSNIARVVKTAGGSTRVKRPLTLKPTNVGPILTDMTVILDDGNEIYISLKNVSGATFANTGYSGAFVLTKNRAGKDVVKAQPSATSPVTDEFLQACGVDKALIAKGLTDYINRTVSRTVTPATTADYSKVQSFLVAQLGFGYVYFRQLAEGKYKIIDLSTLAKAKKVIGSVVGVDVRYPFYGGANRNEKSKQCTIKISTSTGDTYIVEIRSTKGGVTENMQCNIKTAS